jgi:preprotein translocase subunit SecE
MIKKIKSFVNDVVVEMKKVSWPTREQLMESTRVVIATSLIITAFVFIVDQVTTWVYSLLF